MVAREWASGLSSQRRILYSPTRCSETNKKRMIGVLVWRPEIEAADIMYSTPIRHEPKLIRFPMDGWPPTDDDIKRAQIVLAMHGRT